MLGLIERRPEWVLRAALAVCAVAVFSAFTIGGSLETSDIELLAPTSSTTSATSTTSLTTSTTTTTTAPSRFPALAETGPRAVVTPTGIVGPLVQASTAGYVMVTPCGSQASVTGDVLSGAHVVLDPGHGGAEPGAVGPTGLQEKELNLDVALRTARLLEAHGAQVVLTRSSDIRMTLATRSAIAIALQPQVFVSIHHNAAPVATSASPAPEMYTQVGQPGSARLGGLLLDEIQRAFAAFPIEWGAGRRPGVNARVGSGGGDYYGILRRAAGVTSVLSEPAYLSRPEEEALLRTEEFREAEAAAIAAAITRYITTDDDLGLPVDTFQLSVPAGGGGGSSGCVDPPLAA